MRGLFIRNGAGPCTHTHTLTHTKDGREGRVSHAEWLLAPPSGCVCGVCEYVCLDLSAEDSGNPGIVSDLRSSTREFVRLRPPSGEPAGLWYVVMAGQHRIARINQGGWMDGWMDGREASVATMAGHTRRGIASKTMTLSETGKGALASAARLCLLLAASLLPVIALVSCLAYARRCACPCHCCCWPGGLPTCTAPKRKPRRAARAFRGFSPVQTKFSAVAAALPR